MISLDRCSVDGSMFFKTRCGAVYRGSRVVQVVGRWENDAPTNDKCQTDKNTQRKFDPYLGTCDSSVPRRSGRLSSGSRYTIAAVQPKDNGGIPTSDLIIAYKLLQPGSTDIVKKKTPSCQRPKFSLLAVDVSSRRNSRWWTGFPTFRGCLTEPWC